MGKIRRTYSKEIKIQAVQLYIEGELSNQAIADKLGVSNERIIRRWVKHYKNEGLSGLDEKRGKATGPQKGRPRKNPLSLEEEVMRLRAENEFLKKWLDLKRG